MFRSQGRPAQRGASSLRARGLGKCLFFDPGIESHPRAPPEQTAGFGDMRRVGAAPLVQVIGGERHGRPENGLHRCDEVARTIRRRTGKSHASRPTRGEH
ncbi:MAG: hypothetical protein ACK55I_04075 [bacterium]